MERIVCLVKHQDSNCPRIFARRKRVSHPSNSLYLLHHSTHHQLKYNQRYARCVTPLSAVKNLNEVGLLSDQNMHNVAGKDIISSPTSKYPFAGSKIARGNERINNLMEFLMDVLRPMKSIHGWTQKN